MTNLMTEIMGIILYVYTMEYNAVYNVLVVSVASASWGSFLYNFIPTHCLETDSNISQRVHVKSIDNFSIIREYIILWIPLFKFWSYI